MHTVNGKRKRRKHQHNFKRRQEHLSGHAFKRTSLASMFVFFPVEVPGKLDLATRLAKHKQSFLNLLRQNGRRVTKVYSNLNGWIKAWKPVFTSAMWWPLVKKSNMPFIIQLALVSPGWTLALTTTPSFSLSGTTREKNTRISMARIERVRIK